MKNKKGKAVLIVLIILLFISWTFLLVFILDKRDNNKSVNGDNKGGFEKSPPLLKYVSKVIDGDTIIIEGESYRLLGMDTDERGYPCFNIAKKRMEELVLGKEVALESDAEDKDQYQR